MLIGAMNHPRHDVYKEIASFAEMGLGFVDLTLEPPAAASWQIDPAAIRAALDQHQLEVVGHTAYYLPIGNPIEHLRQAAVAELRDCLAVFSQIGVRWMNIHPDRYAPMHDRAFAIAQNIKSLTELLPDSERLGVGLMIENIPGDFNNARQLGELLDELPQVGLHLDIGHCNLRTTHNTANELIETFGPRLRHVHLHDNKGGNADLHLPLGTGNVDYCGCIESLKAAGYDGTITLEVFSPDRHHFIYSRDMLQAAWDGSKART